MRRRASLGRKASKMRAESLSSHALARWLSKYGLASRAEARGIVEEGRVAVNGRLVRDPEFPCHPERQRILVDGKPLEERNKVYLVLHKPVGYITTARDPERRPTVYDLLPQGTPRVQAAGRLDADSSGLLVFTNDTDFASRITEAGGRVEKEYVVRVKGRLGAEEVEPFEKGISLDGRTTLPALCRILERDQRTTLVRVVLREGRNRQVRKMFEALGHPVLSLQRVRIGAIRLGRLPEGRTRSLTRGERERTLCAAAGLG
jgi:23S rRNA pseudouridine2605 synthase